MSPFGDSPLGATDFGATEGIEDYRLVGGSPNLMRITHSQAEHLVVLNDAEAAVLVDACALLVLAAQSVDGAALPPAMATLLAQLFEGLKPAAAATAAADQDI